MNFEQNTAVQPNMSVNNESSLDDYVDYSAEDDSDSILASLRIRCNSMTSNKSGDHPFPVKLQYMLGELESDGLSHVVSWQPHGRCFLVHDQKAFVKSVLPCWFRQSKFTSFQRQLNLYGFRRVTKGVDKGGYYHELFLRAKPLLSQRIQRTKIKGNGPRRPYTPESEPHFYNMPFLPLLPRKLEPNALDYETLLSNTLEPIVSNNHCRSFMATQAPVSNSIGIGGISNPTMHQHAEIPAIFQPHRELGVSMATMNDHHSILSYLFNMQSRAIVDERSNMNCNIANLTLDCGIAGRWGNEKEEESK